MNASYKRISGLVREAEKIRGIKAYLNMRFRDMYMYVDSEECLSRDTVDKIANACEAFEKAVAGALDEEFGSRLKDLDAVNDLTKQDDEFSE